MRARGRGYLILKAFIGFKRFYAALTEGLSQGFKAKNDKM